MFHFNTQLIKHIKLSLAALACLMFISCGNQQTIPQKNSSNSAVQNQPLPANELKQFNAGLDDMQAKNYLAANQKLSPLAKKYPEYSGILLNLANCKLSLGETNEAELIVNKLNQIGAESPELENLKGLVATKRGQYKNAENFFLTAIKMRNNYASAHFNLALLYDIYYQDIQKAIAEYNQYLSSSNVEDVDTQNWVEELKLTLMRQENN